MFKQFLKLFSLTPILSGALIPVVACATNGEINNQIDHDQLKAINNAISDHLEQWASLSFQFQLPSQNRFLNEYLPTTQDLFGFKVVNLNWNAHNDDFNGTKTISYDLVRGKITISNQRLTIAGFLTKQQLILQTQNPEIDFASQIKVYQPHLVDGSIIKDPALRHYSLKELLNDQNLVQTIIQTFITKQNFVLDQVEQLKFRKIDLNAIIVKIRLQATNGQFSSPLRFVIASLNPNYYQDLTNIKQFVNQVQTGLENHTISASQILQDLNLIDYLQDPNKFDLYLSSFWNYYIQDDIKAITDLLGNFWLSFNFFDVDYPPITQINFNQGKIQYQTTLVYRIQKQVVYQKPVQFTIYFQPTL